jgi:glycosyltransferase involved in cell wall biosynthesis
MKANILFITLVSVDSIFQKGIYTDLIRKFNQENYQVFVVCPIERKYKKNTYLKIEENVSILNVKTFNIQKTNIFEKAISTISIEYFFGSAINRFFKNIHFDLILYSTPPITLTNLICKLKNKFNAKTYLLLKDIFPQNAVDLGMIKLNSLVYKYFKRKEEKLYRLSDWIGCMSNKNIEYILNHNKYLDPKNVELNPNCIDLDFIVHPTIKKDTDINPNKVKLLYGGNLGKPQGIDFLIEVLISNINRLDCEFIIIGDGTEYEKLNNWILSNNPENVILKKALPKDEFDQIVASTDVGLIFLDHKFTIPNFPSRILSYLENKLPILLATDKNTDIGEIAEINNFGLWAESNDLETFNSNLNNLINSPSKRKTMGQNGFEFMKINYSIEVSFNFIKNKIDGLR